MRWHNRSSAGINATLQLLVIYRLAANPRVARDNYFYGGFIKENYNLN